jgi:4-amino-4-deoxy-L-arabinose transferase-like glycosyltransferase
VNSWRAGLPVALAIAAAGAVAAVALRPLLPVDETRYLTVAWEMWLRGDWLVPHLNGETYSHKPPLLFWSMHMAWALFGVSEAAARLVPALYAMGSVALTWLLARRLWPDSRAVADCAALLMAGTGLFVVMSSLVMFDTALTVAVLTAMLGLAELRHGRTVLGWALFGIGTGLGVLAKGPVVLVHVLPVAALAPLWWRTAPRPNWAGWYLGLVAGLVIAAAIGLAWAIPAGIAGGEAYRNAIFWGQSAGRVVSAFDHAQPFWFYIAVLPLVLFPWIYWPPAWAGLKNLRSRLDDPLRMVITWAAGTLILLSLISGKQVHYLVPLMPAVALVFARALLSVELPFPLKRAWLPAVLPIVLGAAAIVLDIWLILGGNVTPALSTLPLWLGPAILAVGLLYLYAARSLQAPLALALLFPVLFLVVQIGGQESFRAYSLNETARVVKEHEASGVASLGSYNGEYGFLGRLTRPVTEVRSVEAAEAWAAEHPGGVIVATRRARGKGLELPEIYRQTYRSSELAVWRVPGAGETQQSAK